MTTEASVGPDTGKYSTNRLRRRPRHLLAGFDLLSGLIALGLSFLLMAVRSGVDRTNNLSTMILNTLVVLFTVGLLSWSGSYSTRQRISRAADTGALTRGLLIGFAVSSLLSLVTKGFFTGVTGPSRLALVTFLAAFWILAVAARLTLSSYQQRLFAHGISVRKIMVLGKGREAEQVIEFIHARPWLGVVVAGRLCLEGAEDCDKAVKAPTDGTASSPAGQPRPPLLSFSMSMEGPQRLSDTMRSLGADEIVVALEPEETGKLPQVTSFLSLVRVPFKIVPSLFEETMFAGGQDDITPAHILEMAVDPPDRLVRVVKRVTDICVSLVALFVLILLTPAVALAIVAESGRPIFYKQERLGKYGERFAILKFRTMVANAESLLERLRDQDEGEGPHFKMKVDPRLTRVGAFLRRWSLDELPQFWNVLKGDMSVVGPRPPLPREVAQYDASQLVRLKGKPGITGLWQVSGRKNLSFDDMVRLDRHYLENWSLKLDLSIILRTFSAVVTRRGAY